MTTITTGSHPAALFGGKRVKPVKTVAKSKGKKKPKSKKPYSY